MTGDVRDEKRRIETTDMAKRDDPLEPHPHGHRWGPDGICDHPACTATKPPTQTTDAEPHLDERIEIQDLYFWLGKDAEVFGFTPRQTVFLAKLLYAHLDGPYVRS